MKTTLARMTFILLMVACLVSCSGGGSYQDAKKMKDAVNETPKEEATEREEAPLVSEPINDQKQTEEYAESVENDFLAAKENPLSTFSIDVDNASYANIRRFLNQNQLPPTGAVRIEEMINYFDYDYKDPSGKHPFSIYTEMAACPWNQEHQLIHIGIQGKKLNYKEIKPSNLVFLVDASGSMQDENKLPLLKKSLQKLVENLNENDRIAIVAYAGAAGLVLPSTPALQKNKLLSAMDQLQAGGSTAGGEGIELAYQVAEQNLISGGNNRIILCTDGDFNVGISSDEELVKLIGEKRKKDIYITICGFGMGNYKDHKMELISQHGNGNYFYIDELNEAEKVFVTEMRANLFTIAKDVKIQVEFNPAFVKAYRLIGYENRLMKNEDFDDDAKDAGELGAGHSVTALYEIIPAGSKEEVVQRRNLKYQQTEIKSGELKNNEVMNLKLRYKAVQSQNSTLLEQSVLNSKQTFEQSSENFRFSASVAGFGLLLKNSKYRGSLGYPQLIAMTKKSQGKDTNGYRKEMLKLIEKAQNISVDQ